MVQHELQLCRHFIENFDAIYDIRQQYDICMPYLEAVDKPRLESIDTESLEQVSLYVGAAWCQIVASDVRHRLPRGLHTMLQSKELAEELFKHVRYSSEDNDFALYVVTRWHDGAAKLAYRVGDHTQGRLWHKTARILLKEKTTSTERCNADILSNDMRNHIEEDQAGRETSIKQGLANSYQSLSEQAWESLGTFGKRFRESFDRANASTLSLEGMAASAVPRNREILRGICSLYHNWSTVKDVPVSDRMSLSKRSEFIARALEDGYRTCQALHQQAELQKSTNPGLARAIFELNRSSTSAPRSALMAKQQLAVLTPNNERSGTYRERFQQALEDFEELLELINEIQERQYVSRDATKVSALDVDLYGWTVKRAWGRWTELLNYIGDDSTLPNGRDVNRLRSRMLRELEQMLDAYRSIIKVSTLKRIYGEFFSWAYEILISEAIRSGNHPEALYWVEQATARDLLDTVAASSESKIVNSVTANSEQSATTSESHVDDQTSKTDPQSSRSIFAWHAVSSPDAGDKNALLQMRSLRAAEVDRRSEAPILDSYKRFEEWSRDNTHDAAPPTRAIFQQTLDFSKQDGLTEHLGPKLILRFLHRKVGTTDVYDVMRFYDGYSDLVENLDVSKCLVKMHSLCESETTIELDELHRRNRELSEEIGLHLLDRLLKDLPGKPNGEVIAENSTVIFIPTGDALKLPLHIGKVINCKVISPNIKFNESIAAMLWPVLYCGSLTALVTRGRFHHVWGEFSQVDTIAAVTTDWPPMHIASNGNAFGQEFIPQHIPLSDCVWVSGNNHLSTSQKYTYLGESTVGVLCAAFEKNPQIIGIGSHGSYFKDARDGTTHSFLLLRGVDDSNEVLTPYDIATFKPLKNNQLMVLAACLLGQGGDSGGGEVGGFYRALIAVGAGAIAMPMVPIATTYAQTFASKALTALFQFEKNGTRQYLPEVFKDVYCRNVQSQSIGEMAAKACYALFV